MFPRAWSAVKRTRCRRETPTPYGTSRPVTGRPKTEHKSPPKEIQSSAAPLGSTQSACSKRSLTLINPQRGYLGTDHDSKAVR